MTHFHETYRAARAHLLAQVEQAGGWTLQSYSHPCPGLDGAPLFTDTFRNGPADAQKVLVLVSGTHGVEGFCGSALQAQFVQDAPELPDGVAVLLIHAINPFGFDHLRRVTHENIDLNRNFIDFAEPLPVNAAYAELTELLNPTDMPDGKMQDTLAQLQELHSSLGYLPFMKVVSGGQYQFADGIQFGGTGPSWSRQTVERIWQAELSQAEIIVQIDIHTGLGPSGLGLLMMAADDDEPHKAITADWFGQMVVTDRPKAAEDTVLGGYLNSGLEQFLPDRWVIPMTLEFGTEPFDVVLGSIIEDNWLCMHGAPESDTGHAIKQRLKHAFYPDSAAWRTAIAERGRQVFSQALTGLAALSPDMRR